jgi:hypothetical protein
MSTAAAAVDLASPTRARRKALLSEYQKLKRENDRGTAPWRKEWKYVHYAPGETRGGKPFKEGGVFFRHANCRHEYKTSNPSQTARDHDCATVCSREEMHPVKLARREIVLLCGMHVGAHLV